MTAYWGSNTAAQEILIIGAHQLFFFFPSVVARQQVRETPDILCVCVVFLVGQWEGVQISVCIEEPCGYFY